MKITEMSICDVGLFNGEKFIVTNITEKDRAKTEVKRNKILSVIFEDIEISQELEVEYLGKGKLEIKIKME
jgi:hypothetical protein